MSSPILTLYVMNMSELLYSSYKKNPQRATVQKIIQSDADRAMLYGSHDKIVLTSLPINRGLITDTIKSLRYRNVWAMNPERPTHSLSLDIVRDRMLAGKINRIILQSVAKKITVIPYGVTEEFLALVDWLRKKYSNRFEILTPESVGREKIFLRQYIDQKSGFRDLWGRVVKEIQTPEGFTCRNLTQAINAAIYFHSRKKPFLFKHDTGVSGWGIERFEYIQNLETTLKKIKTKLFLDENWSDTTIVVEEFVNVDKQELGGSPSIEYTITGDRGGLGQVHYEYFCEQVLTPMGNFEGIILYSGLNNNYWFKKLKKAGDKFAQYINQKGYRGCFDIDFVISKDKKTFAVESNPRRTGGTHVWEVARYLLGNKLGQYVIYSNDVLEVKNSIKKYSDVKRLIRDLFWGSYKDDEGIVISGANMLNFGKIGYIAFSKSKGGLNRLNSEVGKRLGRNTSF